MRSFFLKAILFILLALLAGGGIYWELKKDPPVTAPDHYLAFTSELYDSIQKNYWEKTTDEGLAELYRLSMEKIVGLPQTLPEKNKTAVLTLATSLLTGKTDAQKKEFVTTLGDVVLANLPPFGRSRLFSEKQEKDLRNTVANVNPSKDLYAALGVSKDADAASIAKAFEEKEKVLKASSSLQAKELLNELSYARDVLTNDAQKGRYDEKKAEPTVFARTLKGNVYYIYMSQVAPTSFDEFVEIIAKAPKDSAFLILDIRNNIGGAVDVMPYFLGLFLGQGQYAYDFYRQGDYTPFKTLVPKSEHLARFKRIVLLTNDQTQSSGEIFTAVFKKYNLGVVVGGKTKGWGTIENTFPLETSIDGEQQYTAFLVHSITLRDDNQPVEGRGVEPHISIAEKQWPSLLKDYYPFPAFISAVEEAVKKGPWK